MYLRLRLLCLCRLIQSAFVDMENMLVLLTEQKEVRRIIWKTVRCIVFFFLQFYSRMNYETFYEIIPMWGKVVNLIPDSFIEQNICLQRWVRPCLKKSVPLFSPYREIVFSVSPLTSGQRSGPGFSVKDTSTLTPTGILDQFVISVGN